MKGTVPVLVLAGAAAAAWVVSGRVIRPKAAPPMPPRYLPGSLALGEAKRREARAPQRVLTVSRLVQAQRAAGSQGLVDIGGWAYGTLPGT